MTTAARSKSDLPRGMTRDPQAGGYQISRMVDGRRFQRRAATRVEADAIHGQLYGSRLAVRTTRAKLSPYVRDYLANAELRPSSRRSFNRCGATTSRRRRSRTGRWPSSKTSSWTTS